MTKKIALDLRSIDLWAQYVVLMKLPCRLVTLDINVGTMRRKSWMQNQFCDKKGKTLKHLKELSILHFTTFNTYLERNETDIP